MTANPTYEALEERIRDLEARQKTLVHSERWLESIFNALDEAVLVVHPDRKIIKMNTAGLKMFGYTESELVGRSTEMLHVDSDHYNRFGDLVDKGFTLNCKTVFEFELKRKSGQIFPTKHTVALLKDEKGDPVGIVSVVRDMTLFAQTENALERKSMEEALRESELRYEKAERIGGFGHWRRDFESDRAVWSPQLYRIFGVDPEHFKPIWANLMERIHPGDRKRVKEQVSNSLKKGLDLEVEYRIVRPDGIVRHVRSSAETMTQANGKSMLIFGILLDVTEEKRLRMELETNLLQLFRANRLASLGEMVAGVAHEINNPNSLITFNLPLMEDIWRFVKPIINEYAKEHPDAGIGKVSVVELSQDMDDSMVSLKKGSSRINHVVRKLKLFAAPDQGQETQITDVNRVVEETMAIFKTKLKIRVDKIGLNLEEGLPAIQGYPLKLEQVFGNLLINASHAISKKTNGMISITTRHSKDMGAVLVEVEDNGSGMTREQMEKIFDPFFTTRRQDGGTGLGLSISRGIVKEHAGIMGVLSRPDVGTRFTVFLPEEKGVQPALQPNLLIVDDDPSVLKLLRSNFIKIDKRFIQTLSEPESVLEYLAEHPEIDLVLSDIVMPHVNGWQLFKTINARFPLMPVILYSGSSQALDNPFDGIKPDVLVQKPFDRNMLIENIHQFSRLKL